MSCLSRLIQLSCCVCTVLTHWGYGIPYRRTSSHTGCLHGGVHTAQNTQGGGCATDRWCCFWCAQPTTHGFLGRRALGCGCARGYDCAPCCGGLAFGTRGAAAAKATKLFLMSSRWNCCVFAATRASSCMGSPGFAGNENRRTREHFDSRASCSCKLTRSAAVWLSPQSSPASPVCSLLGRCWRSTTAARWSWRPARRTWRPARRN